MAEDSRKFVEFVAHLGHELRSPMNGVLGFAQLLQDDEGRDESELLYLQQILQNAELQVRRVSNLVDLAQCEQNALVLNLDRPAVSEVLRLATEAILDEAGERSVSVSIEAPNAGIVADADGMRLLQVLVDLTGNAARYATGGSTVKGSARRIADGSIEIEIDNETADPGNLDDRLSWRTAFGRAVNSDEDVGLGIPHAAALIAEMNGTLDWRYENGRLSWRIVVPGA